MRGDGSTQGAHVRVPDLDDIAIVTRKAELPGLGQVIVPHLSKRQLFILDQGLVLKWQEKWMNTVG